MLLFYSISVTDRNFNTVPTTISAYHGYTSSVTFLSKYCYIRKFNPKKCNFVIFQMSQRVADIYERVQLLIAAKMPPTPTKKK